MYDKKISIHTESETNMNKLSRKLTSLILILLGLLVITPPLFAERRAEKRRPNIIQQTIRQRLQARHKVSSFLQRMRRHKIRQQIRRQKRKMTMRRLARNRWWRHHCRQDHHEKGCNRQ